MVAERKIACRGFIFYFMNYHFRSTTGEKSFRLNWHGDIAMFDDAIKLTHEVHEQIERY